MDDTFDAAWCAVGRFLYLFARVESALNEVIKRVLDLESEKGEFIVKSFDIAKKIQLAASAIEAEKDIHDKEWLRSSIKVINQVFELNNWRRIIAHQPFEPDYSGGAVFNLSRAHGAPKKWDGSLPKAKFDELHEHCTRVSQQLHRLHRELRPATDLSILVAPYVLTAGTASYAITGSPAYLLSDVISDEQS
jgi:hypothetical protein